MWHKSDKERVVIKARTLQTVGYRIGVWLKSNVSGSAGLNETADTQRHIVPQQWYLIIIKNTTKAYIICKLYKAAYNNVPFDISVDYNQITMAITPCDISHLSWRITQDH